MKKNSKINNYCQIKVRYFSVELAKEFGIVEAVFLQILDAIIEEHMAECVVENGLTWFPCSIAEWENYIDLWTNRQVDRIVKNCIGSRALLIGYYDTDERRRRGWYAIPLPVKEKIKTTQIMFQNGQASTLF